MTYRGRPGVTVTQVFAASAPSLANEALPCVAIGPAYQLVNNDLVGTYQGVEQAYAYASATPGSIVDTEVLAPNELFPITKKPISVLLKNVVLKIIASATTGYADGTAFTDPTPNQFANVVAGDIVVLTSQTSVSIVSAQTNGASTDTVNQRNRLAAGALNQFANVKVGDSVVVTGGTNTVAATYTVSIKLSASILILSSNVNNGVGPSSNVAYSITGSRGVDASFKVKAKTNSNTLVLVSPVPNSPQAPLAYSVNRSLSSSVEVTRLATLSASGFIAYDAAITLPASYAVAQGASSFPVVSANVVASYRCLRTDLASEIRSYNRIADIEAVFGVGQISPANPLAFALFIMKSNTVSKVNGLALGAEFVDDEAVAYLKACDVLALRDVYALQPLSFSPAVHSIFKNHVIQLSDPSAGLERVAIVNSQLVTVGLVQAQSLTTVLLANARQIVTTQVDGAGTVAQPAVLNDATADQFLGVQPGDTVTIIGGTSVTAGVYSVLSKQSSNQITLSGSFITAATPTDIQYFIQRKDGLGADGATFYDQSASFISNSAAAGHFLNITAGTYKGRYKIASIVSEHELVLAQPVLGVVSLLSAVTYKVDRDLSKDEQAENIAGYSSSLGSRRVVHTWSDVLQAPSGSTVYDVPGYFGCDAVAGLTTGLPPQQGFTNLTIGGFLGIKHSNGYFTDAQLNVIAGGGTLVFIQEGPQQPLLIRHQLTTDLSSIKFQEYSVTKNVDSICKFLRKTYKNPIGKYNIVDTTLDYLKTVATGAVKFLRDETKVQFLGGQIRSGKLISIAESAEQIDTVQLRFGFSIPIPLNHIDITVEV